MTSPSGIRSRALLIVNPLPRALRHYVDAIRQILPDASLEEKDQIEGHPLLRRALLGLTIPLRRFVARYPDSDLLVTWPAFGYWDVHTWRRAARKRTVYIVMHDISPLRRQFGYGPRAHRSFARAARAPGIRVVCHTHGAARELAELTGVTAAVIPLPMLVPSRVYAPGTAVRVLGQYKDARSVQALRDIAAAAPDRLHEIHGRGWPAVAGWSVRNEFVPEEEFERLAATAGCVVVPYDRVYQSDVAVRSLEFGTPVVARRHEQLIDLFGEDWPGLVDDGDWAIAVERSLLEPRDDVLARRNRTLAEVADRWRNHFQR